MEQFSLHKDGGKSWNLQSFGIISNINGISFINKETGWAVGGNGLILIWSTDNPNVSVDENKETFPQDVLLITNYPNPFNPSTTIRFTVSESGDTNLSIYTIAGQKVRELLDSYLTAGSNSVLWNGCDDTGAPVSTGIYFARVVSGEKQAVQKMLLMK